ncbi:MAG: hypothetical protein HQM12_23370 [SAR324 cluster bacterium]|nr:hypothetical protein [SAR324 cluster bacterium]
MKLEKAQNVPKTPFTKRGMPKKKTGPKPTIDISELFNEIIPINLEREGTLVVTRWKTTKALILNDGIVNKIRNFSTKVKNFEIKIEGDEIEVRFRPRLEETHIVFEEKMAV